VGRKWCLALIPKVVEGAMSGRAGSKAEALYAETDQIFVAITRGGSGA
jgi:hypothetical protein